MNMMKTGVGRESVSGLGRALRLAAVLGAILALAGCEELLAALLAAEADPDQAISGLMDDFEETLNQDGGYTGSEIASLFHSNIEDPVVDDTEFWSTSLFAAADGPYSIIVGTSVENNSEFDGARQATVTVENGFSVTRDWDFVFLQDGFNWRIRKIEELDSDGNYVEDYLRRIN